MPIRPLSVDAATDIDAPADAVWAFLADAARRPSWMTELRRVEGASGVLEVGDRFTGESSILLHDFIGASEVVEAEPGKVLAEEVVIGARFVSRWEVEPAGDGSTHVRHTIDVEFPSGPFSPIERWVLRRRLLRMQRASLRNLAERLRSHRLP